MRQEPNTFTLVCIITIVTHIALGMIVWLRYPSALSDFSDLQIEREYVLRTLKRNRRISSTADELSRSGRHSEAGRLRAEVAEATSVLGSRPAGKAQPTYMHLSALREFQLAGRGDEYRAFLHLMYPGWQGDAGKGSGVESGDSGDHAAGVETGDRFDELIDHRD